MGNVKKALTIIFFLFLSKGYTQSTLITPQTNGGGIYSKRSQLLNPQLTMPAYNLPDSGQGTRFMWIPERSAFRAGTVSGNQWNNDKIGGYSFATGFDNVASGLMSSAFGALNSVNGLQSLTGGLNNSSTGNQSLVFGSINSSEGSSTIVLGKANTTVPKATNSVLIGESNSAQFTNNFLIGKNNNGKNDLEFAFGFNNSVSAFQSFSVGINNENSASQSFNFGEFNTTKIERAMNIGFQNSSNGIRALAIGNANQPRGDMQIALGSGNKGRGVQSISMGTVSVSNAFQSISGGVGIVNNSFGSVMLGIYNDTIPLNLLSKEVSEFQFVAEDPLFVVGNGSAADKRSNAISVFKNGKMGLSTNSPTEILDVNGSARFRDVQTDNTNTVFLTIEGDGTIKKTKPSSSDFRLKRNIKTLENPIGKVMKMRGVSYEFKEEPDQKRMGFIAQELEDVLPETVINYEDGLKGVRYDDLIPVLLEAIKEQQGQIEKLEKAVENLSQIVHAEHSSATSAKK